MAWTEWRKTKRVKKAQREESLWLILQNIISFGKSFEVRTSNLIVWFISTVHGFISLFSLVLRISTPPSVLHEQWNYTWLSMKMLKEINKFHFLLHKVRWESFKGKNRFRGEVLDYALYFTRRFYVLVLFRALSWY